jgi:hypothetical protein
MGFWVRPAARATSVRMFIILENIAPSDYMESESEGLIRLLH